MSTVVPFSRGDPAFGQADASNCEREMIQIPGSIQPHGALLVIDETGTLISRASYNASDYLLNQPDQPIIGLTLSEIDPQLATSVKEIAAKPGNESPVAITCQLTTRMDCVVHRASSGQLVLEFEQAGVTQKHNTDELQQGIREITEAASLRSLCDTATKLYKKLFGYDRVMVYRFAFEGHGEVFSEQCEAHMEPYLGNHYPASDIPQIARELYKRNRIRMLANVDYEPVSIRPRPPVGKRDDLDMSMCHLRSMSPIHRQYLSNMGVAASMVTSLMCGNALWGLITCHHSTEKSINYEQRLLAELLAEIIATRISALESLTRARAEIGVQQLERGLIEAISANGDWTSSLVDKAEQLLRPLDAIGAVLSHDSDTIAIGVTPNEKEVETLIQWLDEQQISSAFYSRAIGKAFPQLEGLAKKTPGVLAYPVSSLPGEYLIWFRPEHVRTICWGGMPDKPADDDELSPRKSFDKWTEELRDTSANWSESALSVARLISSSIADVIQQFRAMRVMIAHNQLESLSSQVIGSDLPALIADAKGNILLRNDSFDSLLWQGIADTPHISDLPRFFEEQSFASQHLMALLQDQQSWHGGATLDGCPVLIRADTIFGRNQTVLGFVILLTDISDRQLAENARRRFPQRTIENLRCEPTNADPQGRALYESLLEAVVENAQLAAMEITDGIDVTRIPTMLEGVEASVSRTSRLINNLIHHTASSTVQPDNKP